MSVFIDTGVLFAAAHPKDARHTHAAEVLRRIPGRGVSTDHVVAETWTLLNLRSGRHAAMRFWERLDDAPLDVECVTPVDMERARSIAFAWPDQTFSIFDCTSFAVMERLGVRQVATFDNDFAIYRSGTDRRTAFQILR